MGGYNEKDFPCGTYRTGGFQRAAGNIAGGRAGAAVLLYIRSPLPVSDVFSAGQCTVLRCLFRDPCAVHDDLRQLQRTEIPHAGAGVRVRPFELFHGHHCLFPHVHDRKNAPAAEVRHPHAAAAVPRGDRNFYSRPHSGRPARAAGAGAADRAGEGCRGERPQQV